jgi:hypothetical protein
MKACPACGRRFTDRESFCATCAGPDGGPVALQVALDDPAPSPTVAAGPGAGRRSGPEVAIGEQAVVSGEVIGRQQQNIYEGTANVTNIVEVDETKQARTCAVCGLAGTIADGFHVCPGCGRDACVEHFDRQARLCSDCRDAAAAAREDIYRRHALRSLAPGGRIGPWERIRLDAARRSLGLAAARAAALEQEARSALPDPAWGAEQQRQLEAATRLLVDGDDADQAIAYLQPLVERHPGHDALQELWLEALSERDPERALAATEASTAMSTGHPREDVPAVHLARARLLAARGRHQEALDLLADARAKPALRAAESRFIAAAAEVSIQRFLATGNRLFLGDAAARLDEAAGHHDPYLAAVAAWLAELRGQRGAVARATSGPGLDLHRRRIRRLAGAAGAEPLPGHGTGRVFRSHARPTGTVWTAAAGRGGYVRAEDAARDGAGDAPAAAERPADTGAVADPADQAAGPPPATRPFQRLAPVERLEVRATGEAAPAVADAPPAVSDVPPAVSDVPPHGPDPAAPGAAP